MRPVYCKIHWNAFRVENYPVSVVKAGHDRTQQFDQQSVLQTSQKDKNDRIPFSLTSTCIILNNFKLLQNDPETGRILPQMSFIA